MLGRQVASVSGCSCAIGWAVCLNPRWVLLASAAVHVPSAGRLLAAAGHLGALGGQYASVPRRALSFTSSGGLAVGLRGRWSRSSAHGGQLWASLW